MEPQDTAEHGAFDREAEPAAPARSPARPLAGVRVVDLSRHFPGPLAAHLLGDLGASVLKVEEPQWGDPVRESPPLAAEGPAAGRSALATLLLSGSRSIALDLKRPGGREVLAALLEDADVLLETFRPGKLERLGFPPEQLRERHPGLVICSLSGWGQDGPWAPRSGHDLTYQAVAGTLALGASDPTHMPGAPLGDLAGAWSAVAAILAALVARGTTGEGRWIETSLYEGAVHANLVGWSALAGATAGDGAPRGTTPGDGRGFLTGALPCYRLYRTGDRAVLAVALLEPHFWRRFCDAVDRSDLRPLQYRREPAAHRAMEDLLRRRTREQWMALLEPLDLPVEPVATSREAAAHPQLEALGLLQRGEDGLPRLAFPARFDGQRPPVQGAFPELGEATDAVVEELAAAGRLPSVGSQGSRRRRTSGVGQRRSLKRWVQGKLRRWLGEGP